MRLAKWVATTVWVGSWYLMFLEITRWHHVRPSLAFDPGPVTPDGPQPRPGRPLILLYVMCVAAPLAVWLLARSDRPVLINTSCP